MVNTNTLYYYNNRKKYLLKNKTNHNSNCTPKIKTTSDTLLLGISTVVQLKLLFVCLFLN